MILIMILTNIFVLFFFCLEIKRDILGLLWIHFLYLIRPFLSGFQLLSLNAIYLKCDFCTILCRLDKGHSIERLGVSIFCVLLSYTAHAPILWLWGPWRGQDGDLFISVYNMEYGLSSNIKEAFAGNIMLVMIIPKLVFLVFSIQSQNRKRTIWVCFGSTSSIWLDHSYFSFLSHSTPSS